MNRDLEVLLEGERAGTLSKMTNGRLRFVYASDYRDNPSATPLSYSMPVAVAEYGHTIISPWLAGLLPDDPAVLRRWASQFGVSTTEPFDLLATPIGEDCAGAVQFAPGSRVPDIDADMGAVEWLTDADVEARLRSLRLDSSAWLGDPATARRPGFVGQFSLAGRQRKTALLFKDDRWGVPSGRVPTTHILKPPIEEYVDQELNEHLCLAAARLVGLAAADTHVQSFGAESAIVIARYDRRRIGGELRRIHQEDFCQALSVVPDRKYQSQGGPGPEEITRTLRSAMPTDTAEEAIGRFADALAWNWIIGGTDAHAKNYSLLLAGRQMRLAPLYDITSGLPYENERHLSLAMKVGDGYQLVDDRNPWVLAARRMGLDAESLTSRVADLCERAPSAFAEAAADPGVASLGRRMASRLPDLVARRAARCARILKKS